MCPYCGNITKKVQVLFGHSSKGYVHELQDNGKKKLLFNIYPKSIFVALQMTGIYCENCHKLVFDMKDY